MASRSTRKKQSVRDNHPTDWSDWAWDETQSCWVSYRADKHGKYEYQYRADETPQSTGTSTYQDSRSSGTPRYAPDSGRTYGESSQSAYSTSPVTPEYTTSPFEEATTAFENLTLEKGKDREADYVAPIVSASYSVPSSVTPVAHTASPVIDSSYPAGTAAIYSPQYTQRTSASSSQHAGYGYEGQYPPNSGSSSSQQPFYPGQNWQDNTSDQSSFAPQGSNVIYKGMPGLAVQKPLDARFKVQHGREFRFGRVFKILWAEPMGNNGTQITEPIHSRSQQFGEEFVHKIRRFVIVKAFNGHCLCLPIQTYGRKGLTKDGATAHHHAAIYSDKEVIFEGENLTKKGIRVEMYTPREKLDEASRINYAKVYTIEYNVKVFFIGKVDPDHKHRILGDVKNTVGMDF